MMRSFKTIAVALAFSAFAVTSASADQPGGAPPQAGTWQPPAAQQQQLAGDPNEVICKDIKVSGSRLTTNRVCMTRLDWELNAKNARDTTSEWQRHGGPQTTK